ncbi:hypothetical protein [Albidovulum sp.]|nr:hypothetical protein [Paracoccaceae bacterium]
MSWKNSIRLMAFAWILFLSKPLYAQDWVYVAIPEVYTSQPDPAKIKVCVFNEWTPQNSGFESLVDQWTIVQAVVPPHTLNGAHYEVIFNMAAMKDGWPCVVAALSGAALQSDAQTMKLLTDYNFHDMAAAFTTMNASAPAPKAQEAGANEGRADEVRTLLLRNCAHNPAFKVSDCECVADRARDEIIGGRYFTPDRDAAGIANEMLNESFDNLPADCVNLEKVKELLWVEAPNNAMFSQAAQRGADLDTLAACFVNEAVAAFMKNPTPAYFASVQGPKLAAMQACFN